MNPSQIIQNWLKVNYAYSDAKIERFATFLDTNHPNLTLNSSIFSNDMDKLVDLFEAQEAKLLAVM